MPEFPIERLADDFGLRCPHLQREDLKARHGVRRAHLLLFAVGEGTATKVVEEHRVVLQHQLAAGGVALVIKPGLMGEGFDGTIKIAVDSSRCTLVLTEIVRRDDPSALELRVTEFAPSSKSSDKVVHLRVSPLLCLGGPDEREGLVLRALVRGKPL